MHCLSSGISDDELIALLDKPSTWLNRSTLVVMHNLREALLAAFSNNSSGPITRLPSDDIVIDYGQVRRLLREFGLLSSS